MIFTLFLLCGLSFSNFSGPSTALPRCALPKYLTEELQKHIPNAIFSSNPCRLTIHLNRIALDILIKYLFACFLVVMGADCSHNIVTVWLQDEILYTRNCVFPPGSAA